MKPLVLILVCFVAGCARSLAVNPYPVGTRECEQWQAERDVRPARRTFLFEGHDLPDTTVPPGSVPRQDRD